MMRYDYYRCRQGITAVTQQGLFDDGFNVARQQQPLSSGCGDADDTGRVVAGLPLPRTRVQDLKFNTIPYPAITITAGNRLPAGNHSRVASWTPVRDVSRPTSLIVLLCWLQTRPPPPRRHGFEVQRQ